MDKKNTNDTTHTEKVRITKTSYDAIAKSIRDWPQWKKNLCNQELIVSANAKKI